MSIKLTNNGNRTNSLPKVRITEEEKEAVEKLRAKLGMSLSDFVRFCVSEQLKKEGK